MCIKTSSFGDPMFLYFLSGLLVSGCDSSEESIKYYNSTPTATITSHSNDDELLEGVEYTFVGMVSDDNHSADELSVVWSTDVRELCSATQPDVEGTASCRATLEAGETKLKLQVSDPDGDAALASIDISVQETEAPTITLLSPTSSGQYYADQLIEFSAIIADAEDEAADLQYEWESSQFHLLQTPMEPSVVLRH